MMSWRDATVASPLIMAQNIVCTDRHCFVSEDFIECLPDTRQSIPYDNAAGGAPIAWEKLYLCLSRPSPMRGVLDVTRPSKGLAMCIYTNASVLWLLINIPDTSCVAGRWLFPIHKPAADVISACAQFSSCMNHASHEDPCFQYSTYDNKMGDIADTDVCPIGSFTDSCVRGDFDKSPLAFAILYLVRLISWKHIDWIRKKFDELWLCFRSMVTTSTVVEVSLSSTRLLPIQSFADAPSLLDAVIFLSLYLFFTEDANKEEIRSIDNARFVAYFAVPLKNAGAKASVRIRPFVRAALRALALFKSNVYYVVPYTHAGAKAGVIIRPIAQAALRALALFRTDGFRGAFASLLASPPLTRGEYALGSHCSLFALTATLSLRIVSAEELGEQRLTPSGLP